MAGEEHQGVRLGLLVNLHDRIMTTRLATAVHGRGRGGGGRNRRDHPDIARVRVSRGRIHRQIARVRLGLGENRGETEGPT